MKVFWIIVTTLSVMFNLAYVMRDYQDYKKISISSDNDCDVHAVVYADHIGDAE